MIIWPFRQTVNSTWMECSDPYLHMNNTWIVWLSFDSYIDFMQNLHCWHSVLYFWTCIKRTVMLNMIKCLKHISDVIKENLLLVGNTDLWDIFHYHWNIQFSMYFIVFKGYSTPAPCFWRLCAFSKKNEVTLDKVSYESGQKCSKS